MKRKRLSNVRPPTTKKTPPSPVTLKSVNPNNEIEDTPEESLDNFLKRKQQELGSFNNSSSIDINKTSTALERMKALDESFRKEIETRESHWLNNANTLLREIMTEIRNRMNSVDDMRSKDLIRALDIISDKYNLEQGKPTSRRAHSFSINGLTEEELDNMIAEKQSKLNEMKYLGSGETIDVSAA